MFAEMSNNTWTVGPSRSWSTLFGFGLQMLAVLWLLSLPLLYTQSLADLHLSSALVAPPSAPLAFPEAKRSHGGGATVVRPAANWLRRTDYLPKGTKPEANPAQPPGLEEVGVGRFPAVGPGIGLWGYLGTRPLEVVVPPSAPTAAAQRRVSRMMEGNLILRIQPDYPSLARQARVQGAVVLKAIISREGASEHLQVVSGPPLLVESAIRAVRQWRYRPYILDDEPLEVETQITVNFSLGGE